MLTQVESGQVVVKTATIANGASLSDAIDCAVARLGRITLPAAWTAAALTFQVSPDGTNWFNLYDAAGTEYTAQAAASRAVIIPVADFLSVRYLKVRSGTSGAPVAQGAERALTLSLVP